MISKGGGGYFYVIYTTLGWHRKQIINPNTSSSSGLRHGMAITIIAVPTYVEQWCPLGGECPAGPNTSLPPPFKNKYS